MPYFPAVGHIDDSLPPDEVMREYRRRYALAAYHRKREALVQELGGECSVCKSKENLVFVRDKNAPVEFVVNKLATMAEAKREEVMPYVTLMCEPHANEVLYNKGRLTHGTYWAAYKVKCRCEECEEYRANRSLERREDRRAKKADQPSLPRPASVQRPRAAPKPKKAPEPEAPKPRRFIPVPKPAVVVEEQVVEAPVAEPVIEKYDLTGYVPFNEQDDKYSVPDFRRFR